MQENSSLDRRISEDILEELKSRNSWKQISAVRIKIVKSCQCYKLKTTPRLSTYRKRRPAGSLKRLLEGYSSEVETGHLLA